MFKYIKYFLITVCFFGLAACDNVEKKVEAEKKAAEDAVTHTQQPAPQATEQQAPSTQADSGKTTEPKLISLVDGKVSLQLPGSFVEKEQKNTEMMQVYVDNDKHYMLMIITTPSVGGKDLLKGQLKATQETLKLQDPQLEVVSEGDVKAGDLDMEQLTVNMSVSGQKMYSYTALGIVDDKQLTLQFNSPEADQEADFKTVIDNILGSIKVKQ